MIDFKIDFEISLRASLSLNMNSALFDEPSSFSHRRRQRQFN